jgi:hypothetical protein
MSYRLDVWAEEGYLYAHLDGERTPDNIASAARTIAGACLRYEHDSVLADLRDFDGQISIFDSFMVPAKVLPAIKQFRVIDRVAIVDDQSRQERYRFFVDIAGKGGYKMRAFADLKPAIEWLHADQKAAALQD